MVAVDVDVDVAAVWVEDVHEWEEEGWDDRILDGGPLEDLTADLTRDWSPSGVGVRTTKDFKYLDIIRTYPGRDLEAFGEPQTCLGQDTLIWEVQYAFLLEGPVTIVAVDSLWILGGFESCWHRWQKPAAINPAAKLRTTRISKKTRRSLRKPEKVPTSKTQKPRTNSKRNIAGEVSLDLPTSAVLESWGGFVDLCRRWRTRVEAVLTLTATSIRTPRMKKIILIQKKWRFPGRNVAELGVDSCVVKCVDVLAMHTMVVDPNRPGCHLGPLQLPVAHHKVTL